MGMATDGPAPIEQSTLQPGERSGLFERVRRLFQPKTRVSPPPPKVNVSKDINTVRAELNKELPKEEPRPTDIKPEEPPIVPEIRNSYGNRSRFQVGLNGKSEGQWQYAIRDTHTVDAHFPIGYLLREKSSKTSDGTVRHFPSLDDALDFALAKNGEHRVIRDGKVGWVDSSDNFHEDATVDYDPRAIQTQVNKASAATTEKNGSGNHAIEETPPATDSTSDTLKSS